MKKQDSIFYGNMTLYFIKKNDIVISYLFLPRTNGLLLYLFITLRRLITNF